MLKTKAKKGMIKVELLEDALHPSHNARFKAAVRAVMLSNQAAKWKKKPQQPAGKTPSGKSRRNSVTTAACSIQWIGCLIWQKHILQVLSFSFSFFIWIYFILNNQDDAMRCFSLTFWLHFSFPSSLSLSLFFFLFFFWTCIYWRISCTLAWVMPTPENKKKATEKKKAP